MSIIHKERELQICNSTICCYPIIDFFSFLLLYKLKLSGKKIQSEKTFKERTNPRDSLKLTEVKCIIKPFR